MSIRSKIVTVFSVCFCLFFSLGTTKAQSRLPDRNVLDRLNLERSWWNQAAILMNREKVRHITADEDLVYVQTSGGLVTAFDAENGKMKWALQLGKRNDPSVPVASNKKMAVVLAGVMLYGVEKSTGELLWKVKTLQSAADAPALDDKQLYLGSVDGTVVAYDLEKIQSLYQEGKLPAWSFQAIVWRFKTGREVSRSPSSDGNTVCFGCNNGSLYSTNAIDGKLIFQFETDESISAPLSEKGDYVFLVSEDAKIYCIDRNQGYTLWTYSAGLPIRKKALVFEDDLLVLPSQGGLRCLGTGAGELKWWQPKLTGFLAASEKNVYATDDLGNLVVVSRKDGGVRGSHPLRAFSHRVSNEKTDRIFLATSSGLVIALKEKGSTKTLIHNKPAESKTDKAKKKTNNKSATSGN